jgi:hypothetical protein
MFKIDVCKVCGTNCFWIVGIDGELAEKEVCSPECLAQLQSVQQGVQPTDGSLCKDCGHPVEIKQVAGCLDQPVIG